MIRICQLLRAEAVESAVLAGSLLIMALLALPIATAQRSDPLEVLCTGHASGMPLMAAILKREPMTDAIVIPTRIGSANIDISSGTVRRYMRLYFPRTYQELTTKYEFMLLEQIDCFYFTPTQFEWMRRSVQEAGLGGLQDRSVMSMHLHLSSSWAQSVLSDAFPNDADAVVLTDYHKNGNLEIVLNEDPALPDVVKAYKDVLVFEVGWWGNNLMIPRDGSETYTWSKTDVFQEFSYPRPGFFPHILGWRYGSGYTWSVQDILGASFWNEAINPYGTDVMIAMLMYSAGRRLPDDVVMVHELRNSFSRYAETKAFIFSLMEFVDKFGANMAPLESKVFGMDERWHDARIQYMAQDYAESWDSMEILLSDISSLREEALELKDKALLWIYAIEWLCVSGTFLATGFGVWTLMVKRRLYREVASTRPLHA